MRAHSTVERSLRRGAVFIFRADQFSVSKRTIVAHAFRRNVNTRSLGLVGPERSVETRAVFPRVDALAVQAAVDEVADVRIGSLGFAVAVRGLVLLVAAALVVADQVPIRDPAVVRQRSRRDDEHPKQAAACPYAMLHDCLAIDLAIPCDGRNAVLPRTRACRAMGMV